MITITHNRATFKIFPMHEESVREALALIDKTNGRKGPKLKKQKPVYPHISSTSRFYPNFVPGMTTTEYVSAYQRLNKHVSLRHIDYEHADGPAAMLDPSIPEVLSEIEDIDKGEGCAK